MKNLLKALGVAAAGFAAGVLLAPKSGKDTRTDIKNKTDEAKKYAADKTEEVKASVKRGVEAAKKGAKHVSEDAADLADKAKVRAERVAKEAKALGNEAKAAATKASREVKKTAKDVKSEVEK